MWGVAFYSLPIDADVRELVENVIESASPVNEMPRHEMALTLLGILDERQPSLKKGRTRDSLLRAVIETGIEGLIFDGLEASTARATGQPLAYPPCWVGWQSGRRLSAV